MTDLELEIADSFERIFPTPTVIADWGNVLDRADARRPDPRSRFMSRRVVASPRRSSSSGFSLLRPSQSGITSSS